MKIAVLGAGAVGSTIGRLCLGGRRGDARGRPWPPL